MTSEEWDSLINGMTLSCYEFMRGMNSVKLPIWRKEEKKRKKCVKLLGWWQETYNLLNVRKIYVKNNFNNKNNDKPEARQQRTHKIDQDSPIKKLSSARLELVLLQIPAGHCITEPSTHFHALEQKIIDS